MEGIFTAILGIVCIVIGILNTKGNISTIHSYHRKRVSEQDRLPFGRLVGAGTIVIGAGLTVCGGFWGLSELFQNPVYSTIGFIVLGVTFAVGLGLSFAAMIKYNKGIF